MSTLILLAKAPAPGRVKTRLGPVFTPEQAADLAEAALRDTLTAALATSADRLLVFLDGAPGPWLPTRHRRRRPRLTVRPQPPGGLDRRIAAAFGAAADLGPGPALLIGMDTPQVTGALLDAGLARLDDSDAVFGPAADGGFWALGLREAYLGHGGADRLVVGVPMSTPETGARQLERLHAAGLRVVRLPELRDVDTPADAVAVAAVAPGTGFARRLAELRAGGVGAGDDMPGTGTGTGTRTATRTGTERELDPEREPVSQPDAEVDVEVDVEVETVVEAEFEAVSAPGPAHHGGWAGTALRAYEQALWQSLSTAPAPLTLPTSQGSPLILDVARYTSLADPADQAVLARCTGPTLDVGCGPGRLVVALAARRVPALGVDVSAAAVVLTRAAGGSALLRSVFDRLPAEGAWNHVLLIDGNIGIGGDPGRLLRRARELLRPGGELIVETEPDDPAPSSIRPTSAPPPGSPPLPWVTVGTAALLAAALPLGFHAQAVWRTGGRRFAALRA